MWASLFTALEAWNKTASLLEQFGEAYILWKIQKIRTDDEAIKDARDVIIKKMQLARAQRNADELRALNRALVLVGTK